MKIETILRSVVITAALATAMPAFSKPVTKTISISQNSRVGKSALAAGQYSLKIDGTKAIVVKHNKTVAESEGRWEERDTKSCMTPCCWAKADKCGKFVFQGRNAFLF